MTRRGTRTPRHQGAFARVRATSSSLWCLLDRFAHSHRAALHSQRPFQGGYGGGGGFPGGGSVHARPPPKVRALRPSHSACCTVFDNPQRLHYRATVHHPHSRWATSTATRDRVAALVTAVRPLGLRSPWRWHCVRPRLLSSSCSLTSSSSACLTCLAQQSSTRSRPRRWNA